MAQTLHSAFRDTPWPSTEGPVIFIIDARNSFEARLLRQWVESHQLNAQPICTVEVSLDDDSKGLTVNRLIAALAQQPDSIIAPLRLSWLSMSPSRQRPRAVDLLRAGERRPGGVRGRLLLRGQPDRLQALAGAPASSAELQQRFQAKYGLNATESTEEFAIFVARQAAIVLDMAERKLVGGRYKVPRYVVQSLNNNRDFKQRLYDIAQANGRSRSEVMREVSEYFREMISIPTRFWLDVWAVLCRFCLGLGYEPELHYNQADLERVRTAVRNHPSALLWTHKTYIDGFVVPKLLFDNDFPMPHFFGGANLNIPVLGFLVRRSGGIFIKRSFSNNEVYKTTLRQYIGYLMEKRFPLTWSFEGTRSRLGKLMPPKYGILKYVLEGCYTTDSRDIHIVPVTVSYDLVRDAEEYAREQGGVPKAPESLGWLLGYLRSLARPMGKIYVDFGDPVVLPKAPDPEDRLAISKVAFQVAVEANRVTPITLPAVVSMALLGVYPRALTEQEITEEIRLIINWAQERGLRLSPDFDQQYAEGTAKLLELMINERIITRFDGGPNTVFGIENGRAAVASYYRNTIVHYFVNKAITEIALIAVSEEATAETDATTLFWHHVDELRDLFKFEFFYPGREQFHAEISAELARSAPDWQSQISTGATGARELFVQTGPQWAHTVLQIFAESYSLGADLLASLPENATMDESEFVDRCMNFGRQALLQRRISSEASMGKLLFSNAWKTLASRQLTDASQPNFTEARRLQADALNQLIRRIEICRASSIASRGTPTLRDAARGGM